MKPKKYKKYLRIYSKIRLRISKKRWSTKKCTCKCTKKKEIIWKRIKENSKNEFNQIAKMRDLSRDELEQIAKIRKIKNYEDMKKEDLIISLLKSKESIAELFNDNNNNEISNIRRVLNRLRDILPKKDRK